MSKKNPLLPLVVARASGYKDQKPKELPWLTDRIEEVVKATRNDLHRGLMVMFHVGRFGETTPWGRLWSTICVTDFLGRFFPKDGAARDSGEGPDNPMISVFTATSMDSDTKIFTPSFHWWKFVELQYCSLKAEVGQGCDGTGMMTYRAFKAKFWLAKRILLQFSSILRELGGGDLSLNTICDNLWCLGKLMEGVTAKALHAKGSIEELINSDSVTKVLRGPGLDELDSITWCLSDEDELSDEYEDASFVQEASVEDVASVVSTGGSMCTFGSKEGWAALQSIPVNGDAKRGWNPKSLPSLPVVPRPEGGKRRQLLPTGKVTKKPRRKPALPPAKEPKRKPAVSPTGKPKIRITKLRKASQAKTDHYKEDPKIQVPTVIFPEEKPKGIFRQNVQLKESRRGPGEWGLMFDCQSTRFHTGPKDLPVICVETFHDKRGELVRGPTPYEIGSPGYLHANTTDKRLAAVLCCATSSAYMYFFRHANYKPHFVASSEVATEYQRKLIGMDIDLHVIPKWKLKEPVKILTDTSISEGLREGAKEESDFVLVSNETELFQEYFGDMEKIPFPTTKWMEFFDENMSEKDDYGRNFKFGVHDCGWGAEGRAEKTYESQDRGIEFLMAKPALIGNKEMMSTLGPIVDQATMLMDAVCFDNGERLMNDERRDQLFGRELRERTNSRFSRFEAYTLVRQPLGKVDDVAKGKVEFPGTSRHIDGPNCDRLGYTTTGVFSFLCIWRGVVYRTSIIMYTRASCGNYLCRNYIGRKLRLKLRDYIVERNGGLHYHDFSLADSMAGYKAQETKNSQKNPLFFLLPGNVDLSDTFFERNPGSRWVGYNRHQATGMSWKDFVWRGFDKPLRIIPLPEFFCRYGFVSSFAYQINRFIGHGEKGMATPKEMIHQLVYIALLQSSQIEFFYVLEVLIEEKRSLLSLYRRAKKETNGKTDISLFRRYQEICREKFQVEQITGGPYPRFQGQPTPKYHVLEEGEEGSGELRNNIQEVPGIVESVEKGEFLNEEGKLKGLPGTSLLYIGPVGSLSCAPLLAFTGLVKGTYGMMTAKQSMLNTSSRNTYLDELKHFVHSQLPEGSSQAVNKDLIMRTFKSIAKCWNTGSGSVENGCCGLFREKKREDVFFYGQELYNLDNESYEVKVKVFGSSVWAVKKFD